MKARLALAVGAMILVAGCSSAGPAITDSDPPPLTPTALSSSPTASVFSPTSAPNASSTSVSPSESEDFGLGPPPCAPEPTTEFPWQPRPGGPAPYVLKRGQAVEVGVVLSSQPVAYTAQLRIDVVPAAAGVINGAGGELTAGSEPHVLRLDVVKPAPGRYALTFRGLDEQGHPLPAGDYQVYLMTVEATRRTVELGCLPETPSPTPDSPASSLPPDAIYTADGTEMLGTIELIG